MNEVFEKIVNRLFLIMGKPLKDTEKNAYKSLLNEYLGAYNPKDLISALDKIIISTEMKKLPSVYEWRKHLPVHVPQDIIGCNACRKGLRSIAEKSKYDYWYAQTYACSCEAGNQHTSLALWQCNNCQAFQPFSNETYEETKQTLPVCRAYTLQPYNVNCLHWKKRLTEETERGNKPPEFKKHQTLRSVAPSQPPS